MLSWKESNKILISSTSYISVLVSRTFNTRIICDIFINKKDKYVLYIRWEG